MWKMDKETTDLSVVNIVVSGFLSGLPEKAKKQEQSRNSKFPHLVHACFPHESYSPSFPGEPYSCKVFLYAHGVMNCVGIKDYEDVAVCVIRAYQHIVNRFPKHKIRIRRCAIHNIVASGRMSSNIKLDTLSRVGKYNVTYQPSKFPGAYIREGNKVMKEDVTVFKVFHSGKYFTVGSNTHRMIILNRQRFPTYVQHSVYNQVCTLQPPGMPPLAELLAAVNASPLRTLCASFSITRHPSFSSPVLESAPFSYPGDWGDNREAETEGVGASSFLFRTIITQSGGVYEYATRRPARLTFRRRVGISKHLHDEGEEEEDEVEGDAAMEDAIRSHAEIPLRESTLIPQGISSVLLCPARMNASRGLVHKIGESMMVNVGTHFYIRSAHGLLLHTDGDVDVPDAIDADPRAKARVAAAVWAVCGYARLVRCSLPTPLKSPLNLKKIAADFNRARMRCRYEPLADVIRFHAGIIMYANGDICRPEGSRVSVKWMWSTARVTSGSGRSRAGSHKHGSELGGEDLADEIEM
jgi:TATA-box binding protein (TBP) (component of TFIID and TFIIIB)